VKRREAEERQVVLVQEKKDLALQLQAVSHALNFGSLSEENIESKDFLTHIIRFCTFLTERHSKIQFRAVYSCSAERSVHIKETSSL